MTTKIGKRCDIRELGESVTRANEYTCYTEVEKIDFSNFICGLVLVVLGISSVYTLMPTHEINNIQLVPLFTLCSLSIVLGLEMCIRSKYTVQQEVICNHGKR